jgi:hypothetical protein
MGNTLETATRVLNMAKSTQKFTQRGDKRVVSTETRKKISEACSLHGGYRELRRWKQSKKPDRRTPFGRYMAAVEQNLIDDLGGQAALTQKQRLLIDRIIEKLIFLERIGAWSLEQQSIVDSKGNLVPALGKSYVAFSNALRLDLQALHDDDSRARKHTPTIKEIIAEDGEQ